MPHVPTMPPADRFFARIDRFECECPSCSQLITLLADNRRAPATLSTIGQRRRVARHNPSAKLLKELVWNPYTQQLCCPWCHTRWTVGLIFWPVRPKMYRQVYPPPDTKPNRRELLELRQRAGGWWAHQLHEREAHVNLVVETPCSCPDRGTSRFCMVHGWQQEGPGVQKEEAKVPPRTPPDE